jgi:hypothetical protein
MADINLKISTAGLDTGPFTITTNTGSVLATSVSRADLLSGVDIAGIDDETTSITVTSTGECTNFKTLAVDFSGGGGGEEECKNVRFTFDEEFSSCYNWTFAVNGGVGSAIFTYVTCGETASTQIELTDNQIAIECVEMSGVDSPTFTGNGYMSQGAVCFEYTDTVINYINCDGSAGSVTLNQSTPEVTRCIQIASLNVPDNINFEILGNCNEI